MEKDTVSSHGSAGAARADAVAKFRRVMRMVGRDKVNGGVSSVAKAANAVSVCTASLPQTFVVHLQLPTRGPLVPILVEDRSVTWRSFRQLVEDETGIPAHRQKYATILTPTVLDEIVLRAQTTQTSNKSRGSSLAVEQAGQQNSEDGIGNLRRNLDRTDVAGRWTGDTQPVVNFEGVPIRDKDVALEDFCRQEEDALPTLADSVYDTLTTTPAVRRVTELLTEIDDHAAAAESGEAHAMRSNNSSGHDVDKALSATAVSLDEDNYAKQMLDPTRRLATALVHPER
ncbi:unnamed protein product, partial [Amoebophrya sp. A25]|eukprot:GSA25T00004235001.1